MSTLTRSPGATRTTSYDDHIALVLLAAFILSATHTVYGYVAGIGDPSFTVTTPAAWAFYALGFGSVALARKTARSAQLVLVTYLTVLLGVAVFYYPTTLVPRQETTFTWFENDVYTGLLMVATYLGVLRVARIGLGSTGHPAARDAGARARS